MPNYKLEIDIPRFIAPALYNDKKYTCIAAGRQTGKTYNTVQWLLEDLVSQPLPAIWVDTVQGNLDRYVERYFRPKLKDLWGNQIVYSKQKQIMEFWNGSYIDFRSAEKPENIEGFGYKRGVLNEAGIILKGEKGKNLWHKTLQPMLKSEDAITKIVGTPKGKNEFYNLFNKSSSDETWGSYQYTVYDSPFWSEAEIHALKNDPSIPPDVWEQEYLAQFTTVTSNVIVKRSFKESWRDEEDQEFTIDHPWIQKQLQSDGFWFISFDGGMHTTHSAAVLGYHNKQLKRDILIKEFYNRSKNDGIREVALQAVEWMHGCNVPFNNLRLFGDPALRTYGDHLYIEQAFNQKPDLLDSLRESDDNNLRALFMNRKTHRLTTLSIEMFSLRSDNKPSIIVLKSDRDNFGCPQIWDGLFNGQYRYAVKDISGRSIITSDLEQMPPITDLCDAYSYFLLINRPNPIQTNENGSIRLRVVG